MEDSRQVENLIYSYAERIDNGDLEGVAAFFMMPKFFQQRMMFGERVSMKYWRCIKLRPACMSPRPHHKLNT